MTWLILACLVPTWFIGLVMGAIRGAVLAARERRECRRLRRKLAAARAATACWSCREREKYGEDAT